MIVDPLNDGLNPVDFFVSPSYLLCFNFKMVEHMLVDVVIDVSSGLTVNEGCV